MSIRYEDRLVDSPFVQRVWHAQSEGNELFTYPADGSWDMLIMKHAGEAAISVTGPNTQAAVVHYQDGMECIGITFKVGTFMPQLSPRSLVDSMVLLPKATKHSFWLDDTVWQLPDFGHVEGFVARLARYKLIARAPLIKAALENQDLPLSRRSVQRRFLQITGVTQNVLRQIERANYAVELLSQGYSIVDTACQAGYYDQSHLTRALKRFRGQTPAQVLRLRPK